ncbi:hypothetical protein GETHOR_18050 [Geothrix oryzae]|uniref:DUF4402 domain-containing protein n=1 Tax=Geothrix oryzae TaxID=2927975 RepID=A0ABN6UXZ1_9BACT|nr:DUF4402 domain-containing protein [Geothrix oryzae]BDU69704.1 hypothetical protein GETHOR_18050 [Geothrix oryzae]
MRKLIAFALVASPLLALDPVGIGNSDTATAHSFAKIMAPVKVVSTQDLNFGSIVLDELGKAASVELTFNTPPNGNPSLTDKKLVNCGFYNKTAMPTAAFFHYQRDNNFGGGGPSLLPVPDGDPNVSIDITATDLIGPHGKACHFTPKNDLPVDSCLYFAPKEGTAAKHFSVFGKLDIPSDAIPGNYAGTITVKVTYN